MTHLKLAAISALCALPVGASCKFRRSEPRPMERETIASSPAVPESPAIVTPVDAPEPKAAQEPAPTPAPRLSAELEEGPLSRGAQELLPMERKITLSVPDATAGELARLLARAADINILVDEGLDRRGSLELKDVSARDAFGAFASRLGLRIDREGSILVVRDAAARRTVRRLIPTQVSDMASLEDKLRPLVGEEGQVTVTPSAHTVYVETSDDRLPRIESLLREIAAGELQVVIESEVFEVTFDDRLELGVRIDTTLDVGASTMRVLQQLLPESTNFSVAASNNPGTLQGTIAALRTLGQVELLSSPRVAALTSQPASIEILEEVPYIQTTNTVSQNQTGGSTSTLQEVQFKNVGITLKVTPTVLADRSVKLEVESTVSQVDRFFLGIPVVESRNLRSTVFVADGGTFYLGGLQQRQVIDEERKVPILGDIPLLGYLFRSTDQKIQRRELLILLTPRVVQGAGVEKIASDYKDRYRSERQWNRDERPRSWVQGDTVPAVK